MSRRLAEALRGPAADDGDREGDGETEMRFDAALTYSDQDVFRTMDFEKMSLAELAQAKAAIGRLRLPIRPVPTRRFRPAPRGQRVDFRASMRAAVRPGGEAAPLRLKRRANAIRRWWRFAISPARWRVTRACCYISCTRWPPTVTACIPFCSARA